MTILSYSVLKLLSLLLFFTNYKMVGGTCYYSNIHTPTLTNSAETLIEIDTEKEVSLYECH